MTKLKLTFLGIPFSKQADRSRIATGAKGKFVHHYKSKKVKKGEKNIRAQAVSQIPKDFIPFDEPIGIRALFVYPPLKSFPKYKTKMVESGEKIFKDTKPDLTDNLMKGLCDALEGVVFINDSRIAKVQTEKIFGLVPRIEIVVYKLTMENTPQSPLTKRGSESGDSPSNKRGLGGVGKPKPNNGQLQFLGMAKPWD